MVKLTTAIVTVSFGAVLAVIVPAFSPFIRASISSMMQRFIAKTITWTGLYRLWLKTGWKSKNQRDGAQRKVQKMKDDVRKKIQQRKLIQSEMRDGVRPSKGRSSPPERHRGSGAAYNNNNRSVSEADVEKGGNDV